MKATEQYFPVVLFMTLYYEAVLTLSMKRVTINIKDLQQFFLCVVQLFNLTIFFKNVLEFRRLSFFVT